MGTYSPGKLSVVYEMSMHVFPTVPSPTTTHLIGRPEDMFFFLSDLTLELIQLAQDLKNYWAAAVRQAPP